MDMTYVYFQPKHCILHQWVILTNPYSEDISVMRGVLKLGVNVLHESDRAEDLTQKTSDDVILVPPQVKIHTIQLVIQLLKAENLPIMDDIGTMDAYYVAGFEMRSNAAVLSLLKRRIFLLYGSRNCCFL